MALDKFINVIVSNDANIFQDAVQLRWFEETYTGKRIA